MKLPNGDKIMTVSDLIKCLKKMPKNMPVMYAVDAEGNGFDLMPYEPSIMKVSDLDNIMPDIENILLSNKINEVVVIN